MGCSASRPSASHDAAFRYTGQAASEIPQDVTRVRVDLSVKEIPQRAFSGCKLLKEVELCVGLERINAHSFHGCTSLESIVIPSTLREIPGWAFYGCEKLEEVELRDGVECIHRAFYCCASLKRINVPSTVRTIGMWAFYGCEGLEEVKLSDGLERINDQAFYCCRSLKFLYIPCTVRVIEKGAFHKCSNLVEVDLCEGLEQIGGCAFRDCKSLKRIRIPSTVQEIYARTFEDCSSLSEVELRGGLRRIGDLAFYRCTSLVRISIPSTVQEIGESAFFRCDQLEEVEFHEGLRKVGCGALSNCTSLRQVEMPSTVTVIGQGVFQECAQLEQINLCEGLEHIGKDAFKSCESLKRISLPSTSKVIGEGVFQECVQLEEIKLCEGLELIGKDAFKNCKSLKRIVLPSTAKIYFDGAFNECQELMTVELCSQMENVGGPVFKHCSSLRNVVIPPGALASLCFARGCCDLLRVFGSSKNISDALKNRFAGLPIHKLCYYQSQHSIEAVLERLQCTTGSKTDTSGDLSNEIKNNQDCLGMTPLHILACSTRQNLDLYTTIIANQPKSLITEDKWGCLPIFYAIWGNAPQDIIRYFIDSHKAAFPSFALDWDKMVETVCRTRASLDIAQRLLKIRQTFFPGQSITWQKVAQELAISCLIRCKSFQHFDSILSEAVEAFSTSQAYPKLIQRLQEIQQSSLPDTLATLFPYQNNEQWRRICEWVSTDLSLKLFRLLAKCCFSERLDTIGVRKWKIKCEAEMNNLLCRVPSIPSGGYHMYHVPLQASFDNFQSRMVSYEQKYCHLKDAVALLELALWKFKVDELKASRQCKSPVQDNGQEEKEIAAMKGQCLVRCGAGVIIPHVLKFLIGNG